MDLLLVYGSMDKLFSLVIRRQRSMCYRHPYLDDARLKRARKLCVI